MAELSSSGSSMCIHLRHPVRRGNVLFEHVPDVGDIVEFVDEPHRRTRVRALGESAGQLRLLVDGGRYAEDVPTQIDTAGRTAQTVKRLDDVDGQVLDSLSGAQRTELLRHLESILTASDS